jgi:hypothetical protein
MKLLGVFAKYWQPGAVKTRLAAEIGNFQASRLYRRFLETTLARVSGLADQQVLAFTPEERRSDFARLAGTGWKLQSQGSGTLGQRMARFFAWAGEQGATHTVLIGSDSPHLPAGRVAEAFTHLDHCPVVLGPSEDGGYYLLGLRGASPEIFEDIPWSTPRVWPETVRRLQYQGVPFLALAPWYDVDDLGDLRRIYAELRQTESRDPCLEELQWELYRIRHQLASP